MKKKSQIKIQEMAFMLVAVLIFFVLVGLLGAAILYSSLNKEATEIAEQKKYSAITNLAETAEFNYRSKSNCIDADKLLILTERTKYGKYWPFTSLQVISERGLNKSEKDWVECKWGTYPDCDVFNIFDKNEDNEDFTSSFVCLCRLENEYGLPYSKCEIGQLYAGSKIEG